VLFHFKSNFFETVASKSNTGQMILKAAVKTVSHLLIFSTDSINLLAFIFYSSLLFISRNY